MGAGPNAIANYFQQTFIQIDQGNSSRKQTLVTTYHCEHVQLLIALERGESVLIHCLAGAHRAGTSFVVFLLGPVLTIVI
jgi:protein tyrosine/serine phosphatase